MQILNPMIQLVVVYLYTKYKHSTLNDCGGIFDEKCYRITEGGKGGRMEGRTDVNQYTPQSGGIYTIKCAVELDVIHPSIHLPMRQLATFERNQQV